MPNRCRWLLATAVALAAASSAGAQAMEKQAVKQFTSAAKGVLAEFKAGLADERALLEVDLDAFDAQLALGALSPTQAATDLHLSLSNAQAAVRPLASNAFVFLYGAAGEVLTALAGGGPALDGIFPRGFYAGDGGAMDLQVPRVLAEWDRFYASVNKRLAKTRKLAEKQGIGLGVVFARPFDAIAGNWADNAGVGSVGTRPLAIDTVVSASDLELAGDGFIAIGGLGDNALGNVTVELTRPGVVGSGEIVAPAPANDRWTTSTLVGFDNGPVVEGSYFVSARQGTGHFVDASIGVR